MFGIAFCSRQSRTCHVTLGGSSPFSELISEKRIRPRALTGGDRCSSWTGRNQRAAQPGAALPSPPLPSPRCPRSPRLPPALRARPVPATRELTCRQAPPRAAAGNRRLKDTLATAAILASNGEPHPLTPRSLSARVPPSTAAPSQSPPWLRYRLQAAEREAASGFPTGGGEGQEGRGAHAQ